MKSLVTLALFALPFGSLAATASQPEDCQAKVEKTALAIANIDGTQWGILNTYGTTTIQNSRGDTQYSFNVALHPDGTDCGGAWFTVVTDTSCNLVSVTSQD